MANLSIPHSTPGAPPDRMMWPLLHRRRLRRLLESTAELGRRRHRNLMIAPRCLLHGLHLKHLLTGAAGKDGGQHGGLMMTPRLLIPGHYRLRHLLTGVARLDRGRRGKSPLRLLRGRCLRRLRADPAVQDRGRDGGSMRVLLLLLSSRHRHHHQLLLPISTPNMGSCWPPGSSHSRRPCKPARVS